MNDTANITNGITTLLDTVQRGNFRDEVDAKLRDLLRKIQETGKGGKISLELSIQPNARTESVEVLPNVKVVEPKPKQIASIYFITPELNLSRHDTRQLDMLVDNR